MNALRLTVTFLAILVSALPVSADELQLTNGTHVSGTVVRLDSGTLTFKTAYGDLTVPWKEVASLSTDKPVMVTRQGDTKAVSMTLNNASGSPTASPAILAIEQPAPAVKWTGGANAGIVKTGGNTDVSSLRIDGEVSARRPRDLTTATAIVNRASTGGVETARNWTVSGGYDWFVSKRAFVNGTLIFTNDKFRDLDLRTAASGGLGYEVWHAPTGTLLVNGGLGYVREHYATVPDNSYAAVEEAVKLDVWTPNKHIQAFHHHDGFFGVTGNNNLFFRMQNGVRVSLVAGFVATLEHDLDYDRSPAPGRLKTDRTLSFTFGYRF